MPEEAERALEVGLNVGLDLESMRFGSVMDFASREKVEEVAIEGWKKQYPSCPCEYVGRWRIGLLEYVVRHDSIGNHLSRHFAVVAADTVAAVVTVVFVVELGRREEVETGEHRLKSER